jgi:DNA-binding LacI/PurR family transcriptional regulator
MANIKDVAAKANVSVATISNVLNGTKYVSDEVKERVWDAVEETGYIPNNLARSLKVKRTRTIGMIVAYIENPIYAGIFRELEMTAKTKGYSVVVCNSNDDPETEEQLVKLLLSNKVDGLVIVPAKNSKISNKNLIPPDFPLVLLNRKINGFQANSVGIENEKSTFEAVSHLINVHGYKRIAYVSGETSNLLSKERKEGYIQALEENDIKVDPELIFNGDSTFQGGGRAAAAMLSQTDRLEAVFVAGTTMLLGVMFQLKIMNISCPKDIAVMGFSDSSMNILLDPPISSITQPLKELAENAFSLVLKQIEHKSTDIENIILPCKTQYRSSCGCKWEPDLESFFTNNSDGKYRFDLIES